MVTAVGNIVVAAVITVVGSGGGTKQWLTFECFLFARTCFKYFT